MEIKKNEILFIYNSNDLQEREAKGYVNSLKNFSVREVDLYKETLTERQLAELVEKLNIDVASLIDNEDEKIIDKAKDMSDEDLLKYLHQNPLSIKSPIAVYNNSADFVDSAYTFINKDMEQKSKSSISKAANHKEA